MMMRRLSFAVAASFLGWAQGAPTQAPTDPLVGTWRLISYVDTPEGGAPIYAFGKEPIGQFAFTADGYASVNIMHNPPAPQASTGDVDPDSCMPDWYCSYFGAYAWDRSGSRWTVHVAGGNIPSYIGTDQIRRFRIEGRRLIISETYVAAGKKVLAERILERVTN